MRYIDADELIEFFDGYPDHIEFDVEDIKSIIKEQDTADVVEVVRCKDCKYDHKCSHNIIRPSKGGGVIYCPLEYCSEGENNG